MLGQPQKQREYTPGARVTTPPVPEPPKKRRRAAVRSRERGAFPGCCTDVLEPILSIMVKRQDALSVIKLSMVNKWFHQEISQNVAVWRELYLHWRGPLMRKGIDMNGQTIARLRPTIPRSLPNFREKPPRVT